MKISSKKVSQFLNEQNQNKHNYNQHNCIHFVDEFCKKMNPGDEGFNMDDMCGFLRKNAQK